MPGPVDKPRDRPTVPEVAVKLRAYRTLPNRYMGGCVHIIVDDGNVEQGFADSCVEWARGWGDKWGDGVLAEDIEIAELVAALTTSQRRRLYALNTYPDMREDEWREQLKRWGMDNTEDTPLYSPP